MSYPSCNLTFEEFALVAAARTKRWHGSAPPWSASDWACALAEEAGEVCGAVKKMNRLRDGMQTKAADPQTMEEGRRRIADELADVVAYAFANADHHGIDLAAAVVRKFNAVSERHGFPERLL